MQINLTGHHVEITEAMRNYVESRFERLSRHFDHVLDAHVVLAVEKLRHSAEATIQINGGMIDKFIGDGIMASFGAPQPLENASRSAFDAAGDMLARLDQLNIELVQRGHTAVAIGIGIHTGEVLAGHVGSIERHEYTLIGDVVNVASRLEGLTKDVDYPLVCSAITVAASGCLEQFHDLGAQAIKGHSNIHVYGWQPAPARTDVPPPIFERIQP